MNTVHVNASRSYHVLIGSGLLDTLGSHVAAMKNTNKVCFVSETNVWPLYGARAAKSLTDAGLEVTEFVFPAGEQFKNAAVYLDLLYFLADHQITRTDLIVALGGGVVGDLAGFAAATYMRGIPFIQIPTTLLAMVDSSVGGKTAIDLPVGKNLVGVFYQPVLVLCDTDCLNTLPEDIFRDGCAEVIKYGILFDPELFSTLCQQGPAFNREAVIARCVELKRDVVAEDEFDTGTRMLLNLGHTIGHAFESFALKKGQPVLHGYAVAWGIVCELYCSHLKVGFPKEQMRQTISFIKENYGKLPFSCKDYETLYELMKHDKKNTSAETVNFTLLGGIGDIRINQTASKEEIFDMLDFYCETMG